ncbi:Uncharacterized protein FKW44_005381, partial [Caligus rogercresseyi]
MLLMCFFRESSSDKRRKKGIPDEEVYAKEIPSIISNNNNNNNNNITAEEDSSTWNPCSSLLSSKDGQLSVDKKRLSIYSSTSSSSSSDFGFKSGIKSGRALERHPGARKILKQKSSDSVILPARGMG